LSGAAFAAVGIGAALGAWMRWGLSAAFNHVAPNLPLGTLAANIVGGYLIGIAVEIFVQHLTLAPEWRLFIVTGFLGGLTTFSTFSAEAVALLVRNEYGWAVALIAAHLFGSLVMTILGIMTVRAFS
jgi:fluoride exporter